MKPNRAATGVLMAIVGFLCWTVFSIFPSSIGHIQIREAWDTSLYWSVGIPLLLIFQLAVGAWVDVDLWREPLWMVAGHFAGVVLVHRSGTDFGLLPLSILFLGVPMFGALYLAALVSHLVREAIAPH